MVDSLEHVKMQDQNLVFHLIKERDLFYQSNHLEEQSVLSYKSHWIVAKY